MNRSVCVTGAGGSIGFEICRWAARDARRLVLVSLTEAGLYNAERKLRAEFPDLELVPVLGSIADSRLMESALEGVDLVVHAAAHKHVPICETNPLAAIRNNVWGTYRLMLAASFADVSQFCFISTDKAVHPSSIMGATKRAAELVVAQWARGHNGGAWFTVRFGNVLDTAGSVLPLWREQISAGGALTLTDRRCTRYFMEIREAVGLISRVVEAAPRSGTYVLDMGEPISLLTMAEQLIRESGRDVEIRETGLRPGEKLIEELHYGGELVPAGVDRVFRVNEPERVFDLHEIELLNAYAVGGQREKAVSMLWDLVRE